MSSLFKKLHGDAKGPKRGLLASQFLNKDPKVKGYSNPTLMLEYLKSLRLPEIEQLEQAFDYNRRSVPIMGTAVTRTDRANRIYQHPTFREGTTQTGCKIILEAGMKEFLQDWRASQVTVNFTLDELIEECMND